MQTVVVKCESNLRDETHVLPAIKHPDSTDHRVMDTKKCLHVVLKGSYMPINCLFCVGMCAVVRLMCTYVLKCAHHLCQFKTHKNDTQWKHICISHCAAPPKNTEKNILKDKQTIKICVLFSSSFIFGLSFFFFMKVRWTLKIHCLIGFGAKFIVFFGRNTKRKTHTHSYKYKDEFWQIRRLTEKIKSLKEISCSRWEWKHNAKDKYLKIWTQKICTNFSKCLFFCRKNVV